MTGPSADRLQELVDRADILDCVNRYCRGMDRLDRELARSAYHDGAIDDHLAYSGPVDGFLDWAFEYHGGQVRHQHYITNHLVELDGDVAHGETYYLFVGTQADDGAPLTVSGGRYVDRFERRDGRWAIADRVCLVEWMSELPSLLTGDARAFTTMFASIARDRTDASYDRPLVVEARP